MSVLVAVPCYNDGRYADIFFTCLYKQSYADFRVVVCNDGSDEKTSKILEEQQRKHGFDLIVNKCNQGIGQSLNNAIMYGLKNYDDIKYITWFGIDDVPRPNYIEKLAGELDKGEFDAVFSDYAGIGLSNLSAEIIVDPQSLKVGYGLGTSYMYTKDTYYLGGPYTSEPQEDYFFFVKAAICGCKFGKVDGVLMDYRWRSDAVSMRVDKRFNGTTMGKELAKKYL